MTGQPSGTPVDPMRARILDGARRQRASLGRALAMIAIASAILLYRPVTHQRWVSVGLVAGFQSLLAMFFTSGLRMAGPRSPVLRALLDEPERIIAIQVRGACVVVHLSRRRFTLLRPQSDVTSLASALHARCPNAASGAPPR